MLAVARGCASLCVVFWLMFAVHCVLLFGVVVVCSCALVVPCCCVLLFGVGVVCYCASP